MPRYRVTVTEREVRRYFKDFTAASRKEARSLAEAEDWRDWAPDISSDDEDHDTFIATVEPLDDPL